MKLTPFEEALLGQEKQSLFTATLTAVTDLMLLSDECTMQINKYKLLLRLGDAGKAERKEVRDITSQALKDSRTVNRSIVALANTLEDRFGISA